MELIELGCIAIAAFAMAADEALRRAPNLTGVFRRLRLRQSWRFLPAALVSFAAALFIAQMFGLPNSAGVVISVVVIFVVVAAILFRVSSNTAAAITTTSAQPAPHDDFPARIFHFRSNVNFDHLSEFWIKLELRFFNGSDEPIRIESVSGLITCDPFQSAQLPSPHLDISETTTESEGLAQFLVTLEQRVPKELTPLITQKLDAGMPFSFTLTDLTLWLRRVNGGEPFAAKIWPAISCEKKISNRLRKDSVCGWQGDSESVTKQIPRT